ncbi:hypothetical protein VQ03_07630 [Methylobacterium tarhaniae]|uniref:Uncharacterized protein n=1 Tax=Methylobacterium tarhaniae TaxID=1187852 RepID=A0A0J6TCM1_9HYPH|nr:hypothetical protein [Methylobacterium tarhaniae]KMO43602.1 hypothetical protein VQ03_07630 [Methylobacterium tarhaniae]
MSDVDPALVRQASTTVTIPAERLPQLRALAKTRGMNAAGVIEAMLSAAMQAGEIPDELEGFKIIPDDDVLFVNVRGGDLPPLDRIKAQVLAVVLEAAAGDVNPELGVRIETGRALPVEVGAGKHRMIVLIGRHAHAVLVNVKDVEADAYVLKTAMTAGMARDFARLLRKHAVTLMQPVPGLDKAMAAHS